MKKIRILLADDHVFTRIGLRSLIDEEEDLTVVGEAENGVKAVALAHKLCPDVVIMDLMMPELSGAEATKLIREDCPNTRVLVLTTFGSSADMALAIANGASGALLKDASTDTLLKTIRSVTAGKKKISRAILESVGDDLNVSQLTGRQMEILHSITRGLTNDDIAAQLGITKVCVKKHLTKIFTKIGAANRSEAVAIALRKHLLKI